MLLWVTWNEGIIPPNYRQFTALLALHDSLKKGLTPPDIENKKCNQLIKDCIKYNPSERLPWNKIVSQLEEVLQSL